jgi:hypothetical protein
MSRKFAERYVSDMFGSMHSGRASRGWGWNPKFAEIAAAADVFQAGSVDNCGQWASGGVGCSNRVKSPNLRQMLLHKLFDREWLFGLL